MVALRSLEPEPENEVVLARRRALPHWPLEAEALREQRNLERETRLQEWEDEAYRHAEQGGMSSPWDDSAGREF